jgi:hypothetical protein
VEKLSATQTISAGILVQRFDAHILILILSLSSTGSSHEKRERRPS